MANQRKRNSRDDKSANDTKRSPKSRFENDGNKSFKDDGPRKFSKSNDAPRADKGSFAAKDKFSKSKSSDKPFSKRPATGGRSSDGDSRGSYDKPYRKPSEEGKSFVRPYSKRPSTGGRSSDGDSRGSSDKPYRKSSEEGKSFDRPYSKRPSTGGRSSDGESRGSYDKPYRKPSEEGKSFDRPFSKRPSTGGRSSDGESRGSYDKPYRKPSEDGKSFDRPYSKRPSTGGRSFDGDSRGGFDKPYRKSSEEGKSFDRPFSKRPSTGGRSSDGDSRGKFDKPYRKSNEEGKSFDRPYSKKPYSKNPQDNYSDGGKVYVKRERKNKIEEAPQRADGLIRLNRYISNAGICSRRKADELIEAGVVSVNGEVISELGYRVNPNKDQIKYNGELLKREKKVYVLLNKPKDYITTTDDPQERKTVMELVAKASRERIYPIGRLDRNTSGLLLLTNDGELADKLSNPKRKITKIYQVELNKNLLQGDLNKISYGIELEDGMIKPDSVSYVQGASKKEIGIQIQSGKNRVVRRIFEHLGYDVVKLDRVVYANLTKKDLPRGKWRFLEDHELIQLKHLI